MSEDISELDQWLIMCLDFITGYLKANVFEGASLDHISIFRESSNIEVGCSSSLIFIITYGISTRASALTGICLR